MDKNTFIEKIKSSTLNEDRKQKILTLLENNDLDTETQQQINDIIQGQIEEIDIDLTPEDMVKLKEAENKLEEGLTATERELNEDMQFVENELEDLAKIVQEVEVISDEVQIEALSTQIKES